MKKHLARLVPFLVLPFLLLACSGGQGELKPVNGSVSIPLSEVGDGKAHFYTVRVDDKVLRLFVVKSPDGVTRAALDACDVCYQASKGYKPDGEYMICNNCGQRFHVSKISEVKGGCNPHPLAKAAEGSDLLISMDALREGKRYF